MSPTAIGDKRVEVAIRNNLIMSLECSYFRCFRRCMYECDRQFLMASHLLVEILCKNLSASLYSGGSCRCHKLDESELSLAV